MFLINDDCHGRPPHACKPGDILAVHYGRCLGKYGDVGCCFQQMFNDFASGGPTAGAKTTVV